MLHNIKIHLKYSPIRAIVQVTPDVLSATEILSASTLKRLVVEQENNENARKLGLSPLHEHKFRHCFQDTLNPLCECAKDIESTVHFFLHCTNFLIPRQTLFQKIRNIDDNILSQSETQLTQTLLYGNQNYHPSINRLIINSTIECIISTKRFKCVLFN